MPHETVLGSDCKYLRSGGRIAIERAKAIQQSKELTHPCPSYLLDNTGTSCEMPKSPDVRIFLHTNYDFVHWMTFSLGIRVAEKTGKNETKIFTIEENSIKTEAEIFVRFCREIIDILDRNTESSIHFYYWDTKQYEHFQRLIERHRERIQSDPKLAKIVFLSPPSNVLPNPSLETWQSPRTIISDVLAPRLVAPIPYHYSLLETARHFHDASKTSESFTMPEVDRDEIFGGTLRFEESLNSQLPSELIYDLWNLSQNDNAIEESLRMIDAVDKVLEVQLKALESITLRTESEMGDLLFSPSPQAKEIKLPVLKNQISMDGEIWLQFSNLNASADGTGKEQNPCPLDNRKGSPVREHCYRRILAGYGAQRCSSTNGNQRF